jgi:hypothetical protein
MQVDLSVPVPARLGLPVMVVPGCNRHDQGWRNQFCDALLEALISAP